MPSRRGQRLSSTAATKLGRLRVQQGLSQRDIAELTGVSDAAYWRLEHNRNPHDVNLRVLVNCSQVLRVELDELIEDEWREWWVFDQRRLGPPERS